MFAAFCLFVLFLYSNVLPYNSHAKLCYYTSRYIVYYETKKDKYLDLVILNLK